MHHEPGRKACEDRGPNHDHEPANIHPEERALGCGIWHILSVRFDLFGRFRSLDPGETCKHWPGAQASWTGWLSDCPSGAQVYGVHGSSYFGPHTSCERTSARAMLRGLGARAARGICIRLPRALQPQPRVPFVRPLSSMVSGKTRPRLERPQGAEAEIEEGEVIWSMRDIVHEMPPELKQAFSRDNMCALACHSVRKRMRTLAARRAKAVIPLA